MNSMYIKGLVSIIALLLATTASGCSFGPDADIFKTIEHNYPQYQYVISGMFGAPTDVLGEYPASEYDFEIYAVHKGTITAENITIQSPGHSCGISGAIDGHVVLMMNELGTIDKSTPLYTFDSKQSAIDAGALTKIARLSGPTTDPLDNFVLPTALPVQKHVVDADTSDYAPWWRKIALWITGLLF